MRAAAVLAGIATGAGGVSLRPELGAQSPARRPDEGGHGSDPELLAWRRGDALRPGGLVGASAHWEGGSQGSESHLSYVEYSDPIFKRGDDWPRRIFLPDYKLAFCYIPKVASSEFNQMFNELNNKTEKSWQYRFEMSTESSLGIDFATVSRANGWRFAYFTRDPLSRYASAYGSKCLVDSCGVLEDGGKECYAPAFAHPVPLEDAVHGFEKHVLKDKMRGYLPKSGHWTSQYKVLQSCGADFLNHADFNGTLSRNVTEQVGQLLSLVGLKRSRPLAEKFFPPRGVRGHRSVFSSGVTDFFRNETILGIALDLLSLDYKKLRLPQVLPGRRE